MLKVLVLSSVLASCVPNQPTTPQSPKTASVNAYAGIAIVVVGVAAILTGVYFKETQ